MEDILTRRAELSQSPQDHWVYPFGTVFLPPALPQARCSARNSGASHNQRGDALGLSITDLTIDHKAGRLTME